MQFRAGAFIENIDKYRLKFVYFRGSQKKNWRCIHCEKRMIPQEKAVKAVSKSDVPQWYEHYDCFFFSLET